MHRYPSHASIEPTFRNLECPFFLAVFRVGACGRPAEQNFGKLSKSENLEQTTVDKQNLPFSKIPKLLIARVWRYTKKKRLSATRCIPPKKFCILQNFSKILHISKCYENFENLRKKSFQNCNFLNDLLVKSTYWRTKTDPRKWKTREKMKTKVKILPGVDFAEKNRKFFCDRK